MVSAVKCDACNDLVERGQAVVVEAQVPAWRKNSGDETFDVWQVDVCMRCVNCKTLAQVLKESTCDIRAQQLKVKKR